MIWIDFTIGVSFIILGITLIIYYYNLKEKEKAGLSFKIRTGGVGCIIIGIGFIIRSF